MRAGVDFNTKGQIGLWILHLMRGNRQVIIEENISDRADFVPGTECHGNMIIVVFVNCLPFTVLKSFNSIKMRETGCDLYGKPIRKFPGNDDLVEK
jgi:hypothetical protein